MGGGSPAAPAAIDASKASGEYLFGRDFSNYSGVTDPRLQSRILSAEAQYRPQYAGLELQDINTYMLGSKAIDPYQTMQRVKTGGGREMKVVEQKKGGGFLSQIAGITDPLGIMGKMPGTPEYLANQGDKMLGGGGSAGGGLLPSGIPDPLGLLGGAKDQLGGLSKYTDPLGINKLIPGSPEYLMAIDKANKDMGIGTASSTKGLVKRNGKWYTADTYEDKMVDMPGIAAQKGVIDLTSIAAEKAAEIDRASNAAQRKQDLEMLTQYGGQTTEAMRASDPYSRAIAEAQQKYAEDAYRNAGTLGFEEQRQADQQARMMGQQAGRIGDNATIAAQMMNRQNAIAQRGQMAQQAGTQAFGFNRALSGDPAQILLGRPGSSAGMGSQFFSQAAGLAQGQQGPQLFDPNAGVNLALQNSANKSQFDASIYGAKSAMKGAIIGGALSGIGGAAGGFCWVAREVYGVDNPSWMLFREWMFLRAPAWFVLAYGTYGEKFALWIANKPKLKKLIRWWMNGRIATYLKK
jgi:hypothetical protein